MLRSEIKLLFPSKVSCFTIPVSVHKSKIKLTMDVHLEKVSKPISGNEYSDDAVERR